METIYFLRDLIFTVADVEHFIIYCAVFSLLELINPAHCEKNFLRPGQWTDILHFIFSGSVIISGLKLVIYGSDKLGQYIIPQILRDWIFMQPMWLQVLAITIIADLGFYVTHRMMHEYKCLWRFHAVHHSSEQLDWLAAFRVHPFDQLIVKGSSLFLIFFTGFSKDAIIIASTIYMWQSLLLHSNFRSHLGYLGHYIASPVFHHWHHANEPGSIDKNFGGQLLLWDRVFGTLNMPKPFPEKYGIDQTMPSNYFNQLMYPFICLLTDSKWSKRNLTIHIDPRNYRGK